MDDNGADDEAVERGVGSEVCLGRDEEVGEGGGGGEWRE